MNLRLLLLDMFMPSFIKAAGIRELFRLTATAFDAAPPDLSGLTCRELLEEYARFTRAESDKILEDERKAAMVGDRLRKTAFETGVCLKKMLEIKNFDEVLIASRIFYRILGIEFSGDKSGAVTISKCFFAGRFSPENCRFISAMDEGVAHGLSGGVLEFTQRITEKKDCCRAKIIFGSAEEFSP